MLLPSPRNDVHVLISGAGENVTSHGQRDSADVIQLRILQSGDSVFSCWVQCNYKGSYKYGWRQEVHSKRKVKMPHCRL